MIAKNIVHIRRKNKLTHEANNTFLFVILLIPVINNYWPITSYAPEIAKGCCSVDGNHAHRDANGAAKHVIPHKYVYWKEERKDMFYLTTHSTHLVYGYNDVGYDIMVKGSYL